MSTDRIKLIMPICLCVGVLFSTLACALMDNAGGGNSLAPVKILTLTIDKSQREDLFDQLQKFADEHALKLVLTDQKPEHFFIELWRNDILITAGDVPPDPTLIYIAFYWKRFGDPVDEEVVDDLSNDLKGFINEIPNVTITEEK